LESRWELFNIAQDPAERNDLAAQNTDKLQELLIIWDKYAKENNVILPDRTVLKHWKINYLKGSLFRKAILHFSYQQFIPPADMMAEPKKIKNN